MLQLFLDTSHNKIDHYIKVAYIQFAHPIQHFNVYRRLFYTI